MGADKYIIATSPVESNAGGAVGIVVAVLFVIGMILAVLYVIKRKNIILLTVKKPESPTVAFENPFYASREQGGNTATGGESEYNVHISSSGSWHSELASSHSGSSTTSGSSPQPSTGQNSPGQDRAELQEIQNNQVLDEEDSSPGGLLGRLGQARNGFTW